MKCTLIFYFSSVIAQKSKNQSNCDYLFFKGNADFSPQGLIKICVKPFMTPEEAV